MMKLIEQYANMVKSINDVVLTKNSRDALALIGFFVGTCGYVFSIYMVTRTVNS